MLYLRRAICCAKSRGQFPLTLQVFPTAEVANFCSPGCAAQLIWRTGVILPLWLSCGFSVPGVRVCFSPLCRPEASLPPAESPESLSGSWPCLHPYYLLQCDLFSVFCCGQSVLPVFGSLSGLFTPTWMLSRCILGWSELRILLPTFSWKSAVFFFYKFPAFCQNSQSCVPLNMASVVILKVYIWEFQYMEAQFLSPFVSLSSSGLCLCISDCFWL